MPETPFDAADDALSALEARLGPYAPHPASAVAPAEQARILDALARRLADNFPFFHPRYAGQMQKPPHAIARQAYALAMRVNPNNHALDGGRATAAMEREAVSELARMVGFERHLGHLTGGGTMANLEALWVARKCHPEKGIAHSSQAHYTHGRMAEVLGMPATTVAVDAHGRMDLSDLAAKLESGTVGTVVVTLGTTGLGAVDPLEAIIPLARAHGARVHVDAAYGGYYRLLAESGRVPRAPYLAMAQADSIVIDPHKHGLQPFGCGSVLFSDPGVGRFYKHDSPYTYFTSAELHLGEITLECSRPGAAAAALWATMQAFPLQPDSGLGPILGACRRAALDWASRIRGSAELRLVMPPELDIVTFFPAGEATASAVSARTDAVFASLMDAPEPVFLAKLRLPRALVAPHHPDIRWDMETVTVLRSCLLKPEHEAAVEALHAAVAAAARFAQAI